ncbi:MAG: hypothetical protein ACK52I_06355 [Pseudomonadota bacterium]
MTGASGSMAGFREAGGDRLRLECSRDRSLSSPQRLGGALTAIHGT